jgi:hypothetical protein
MLVSCLHDKPTRIHFIRSEVIKPKIFFTYRKTSILYQKNEISKRGTIKTNERYLCEKLRFSRIGLMGGTGLLVTDIKLL